MRRRLTEPERRHALALERELSAAPASTLQRREFLQRTAVTAGLAGAAALLPQPSSSASTTDM